MSLSESILLGVVQGVTEFVPVSSSGHLIFAREFLGVSLEGSLAFDALLHLATALAVVIYFRKDITDLFKLIRNFFKREELEEESKDLLGALIIGTIPAVVIGLFFENAIENTLRGAHIVAWALIAGSVLFLAAEWFAGKKIYTTRIRPLTGLIIGFFQSLALIPGMSRSGSTISGGMLLGLDREQATRFAFLLSIPILFGVGAQKILSLLSAENISLDISSLLVSSVVAFGVGYAAIHWMLRFLKKHTLYGFALYRIALAIIVLLAL